MQSKITRGRVLFFLCSHLDDKGECKNVGRNARPVFSPPCCSQRSPRPHQLAGLPGGKLGEPQHLLAAGHATTARLVGGASALLPCPLTADPAASLPCLATVAVARDAFARRNVEEARRLGSRGESRVVIGVAIGPATPRCLQGVVSGLGRRHVLLHRRHTMFRVQSAYSLMRP